MFEQVKAYYKNLVPSITEEDWAATEQCLKIQHLKKGETLLRHGEICRQVSFINKGLMRMFYLNDGKEICTGFIAEDHFVSEYASFLTRTPATQTIEALEDSELVHLSFDDMQELYRSHPVFEIFGRKIAEYLYILLSNYNNSLRIHSPEQRYQSIINWQPFIIQRVPQYMIASFIGVTPEHLSRLRSKRLPTNAGNISEV